MPYASLQCDLAFYSVGLSLGGGRGKTMSAHLVRLLSCQLWEWTGEGLGLQSFLSGTL